MADRRSDHCSCHAQLSLLAKVVYCHARPKDFNRYLADVVKDSIHANSKTTRIETVTSYLQPGDTTFEEIWKNCDVFVTTANNFRMTQTLLDKATTDKKPFMILDVSHVEVSVYSLLNPSSAEKVKVKYVNSKQALLAERSFTFDLPVVQHPYSALHCLYWAMALFDTLASHVYNRLDFFLKHPQYAVEQFEKINDMKEVDSWLQLELFCLLFDKNYPFNFKDLVILAVKLLKV